MLFGGIRLVGQVIQPQAGSIHLYATHLAAADTLTFCPAPFHFILYILSQTGAAISFHNVSGRNIADNAIDAAIARNGRFDLGDEVDQFFGGVWLEFAALPVFIQLGIRQQLIRVDLDLVRAEVVP